MAADIRDENARTGSADRALTDTLEQVLEAAPVAFAITHGAGHLVVLANAKFRGLFGMEAEAPGGRPVASLPGAAHLLALLDRTFNEATAVRDVPIRLAHDEEARWSCTAWPLAQSGQRSHALVIELRETGGADPFVTIQRQVAERMLISALRERDLTDIAEASHERAAFLADVGRELAESIDIMAVRETIAGLRLPKHAAWCIVDIVERGALRRLAIVHPDPSKQTAARSLERDWSPAPDDPFGAPAMMRSAQPTVIVGGIEQVLDAAAHSPKQLAILRDLGMGSLLTVPMTTHGRLVGAITFVSTTPGHEFDSEAVRLASDLGARSALALDNARLYDEAVGLRTTAQDANRSKSDFLAHMSHELRTPLNAIGGYVDILDLEIHGPVTSAQRLDLERIKLSAQHLLIMINDILNFIHVDGGTLAYDIVEMPAAETLARAVALIEPLILAKQLTRADITCDPALILAADPDRTMQILINLLNNAVKFTPSGGSIAISCEASDEAVLVHLSDTGVGISPDNLERVFEPFVQVQSGLTDRRGGVGLGLAISRELARAMNGDLTVTSTPGVGSRFTLKLPRARSS